MARLTVQKPGIELEMVVLLYKRLQKQSCDVKLKTLRAMLFILIRGSAAVRYAMQRDSQIIRQHLRMFPPTMTPARRLHLPLLTLRIARCSLLTARLAVQTLVATRTRFTATPRGA
jgi:hypothetical protein